MSPGLHMILSAIGQTYVSLILFFFLTGQRNGNLECKLTYYPCFYWELCIDYSRVYMNGICFESGFDSPLPADGG